MAENLESIAGLFGFGEKKPDQPPRFAKVTAISGDTVTVTVGASNVDAVRCCDCAVDDVVLLETMPSGQLAAVAVKGYNGGGGGGTYTAGTGLTLSGTTFNHSNAVAAGWIGSSLATSGNIIKMPYAQFDAQGHITNKGTIDHTSWSRGTPWLLGDAFVFDQKAIYPWPYINVLNNGFYSLTLRGATVTFAKNGTTVTATAANLFDGNYDSHPGANFYLGSSDTGVITIDFTTMATGYFPETSGGYPYGDIILSFYYKMGAANVTARGYTDYNSQGWKTITVTELKLSTQTATYEGTKWLLNNPGLYQMKTLEITITGRDSGGTPAGSCITQIELNQFRPNVYTHPYIGKYSAETLYHRLTGPYFRGVFEGNSTWYGTCSTAAGTTAKVVTCNGFVLATGAVVHVLFSDCNTNAQPTLNVNSTGAKTVRTQGSNGAPVWYSKNQYVSFVYTGTYWDIISIPSVLIGSTANTSRVASANTSVLRTSMQHILASSSMTTAKPAWDGHIIDLAWDASAYTGQLYIPNTQNSPKRPGWRAMKAANSWVGSSWDYFYTDAYPPALSACTGTATVAQIPIDGVSIVNNGGVISSAAAAVCTESSDGALWSYYLTTAVGDWVSHNRGWREEKYSDGRLVVWFWDWYGLVSGSPGLTRDVTETFAPASGEPGYGTMTMPTAFIDTPTWSVDCLARPYNTSTYSDVNFTVTDFTPNTSISFHITGTANCRAAFCLRMAGHWA